MLYAVLHAFEQAKGPLALDELARQLGVERAVLDDMIAFWVRKGRLRDSQVAPALACPSGGCHGCSANNGGCVFDQAGPRTITMVG